jgi:tetratricopeptide (TPR) repeat protein
MSSALLLGLALAAHQYTPADAEQIFRAANEAYLRGDFAQAVDGYQRLADDGYASADIEYNLGDAYHALNKRGLAILAFERAVRLDPGDEDAQVNLERARRELVDKVAGQEGEPLVDRVANLVPGRTVTWVFLAAYAAFWLGLLARRFTSAGGWAAALAAVGLVLALPSGALVGVQAYRDERLHEAVVTGAVVPVHEGPSASSKVLFELHEGTAVRVTDRDQSFAKVRLRNNLEGWAEAGAVTEI